MKKILIGFLVLVFAIPVFNDANAITEYQFTLDLIEEADDLHIDFYNFYIKNSSNFSYGERESIVSLEQSALNHIISARTAYDSAFEYGYSFNAAIDDAEESIELSEEGIALIEDMIGDSIDEEAEEDNKEEYNDNNDNNDNEDENRSEAKESLYDAEESVERFEDLLDEYGDEINSSHLNNLEDDLREVRALFNDTDGDFDNGNYSASKILSSRVIFIADSAILELKNLLLNNETVISDSGDDYDFPDINPNTVEPGISETNNDSKETNIIYNNGVPQNLSSTQKLDIVENIFGRNSDVYQVIELLILLNII